MRSAEAEPLLAAVPEEQRFSTWHLVERDGTVRSRGRGGVAVLGHASATRALARPLGRAPAERPLDLLYALVARHKSALGRLVPDGRAPHRYP